MNKREFATQADWLRARETVITGTKIKDLSVKPRTQGVMIGDKMVNSAQLELAAGFLTVDDVREGVEWHNPAERGLFLEPEAFDSACEALKDELAGVEMARLDNTLYYDDSGFVGVSPDSISADETVAIETKCLKSSKQLLACLAKNGNEDAKRLILSEFHDQLVQYFVVIDKLETLYIAFYDPRFIDKNYRMVYLKIKRDDLAEDITRNKSVCDNSIDAVRDIIKSVKISEVKGEE